QCLLRPPRIANVLSKGYAKSDGSVGRRLTSLESVAIR
nr:hypothetical protein [Tanacetum cinerariifolium]